MRDGLCKALSPSDVSRLASKKFADKVDGAETMMKLLDALEDLDDVQKVYSNAEIPDDILAELS